MVLQIASPSPSLYEAHTLCAKSLALLGVSIPYKRTFTWDFFAVRMVMVSPPATLRTFPVSAQHQAGQIRMRAIRRNRCIGNYP